MWDVVPGDEAIGTLLLRIFHHARWIGLRPVFGRSEAAFSRILLKDVDHVDRNFRRAVIIWDQSWLTKEDFVLFCGAMEGGAVPEQLKKTQVES